MPKKRIRIDPKGKEEDLGKLKSLTMILFLIPTTTKITLLLSVTLTNKSNLIIRLE
jgi:hypothetical protein